jgi:hypothetical protein
MDRHAGLRRLAITSQGQGRSVSFWREAARGGRHTLSALGPVIGLSYDRDGSEAVGGVKVARTTSAPCNSSDTSTESSGGQTASENGRGIFATYAPSVLTLGKPSVDILCAEKTLREDAWITGYRRR